MSDFNPEIIKQAVNDPGIAMQIAGMLMPSVTRYSHLGNSTYRPGQVLSSLGQGYDSLQRGNVMRDLNKEMAGRVQTATTPPWEQPDTIGMSTNPSGVSPPTLDPGTLEGRAQWKPQLPIYADIVSNLTPQQARYSLGQGGGLEPGGLSPIFDKLTTGAHERVATQQAQLLDQAVLRYRNNPNDADAENAIMLLSSAPAVGQVGGGGEKVNQMRLMMQRDSYLKSLDGLGNSEDKAMRTQYAANPELLRDRVQYLTKRQRDADQAYSMINEMQGKIPQEQFEFWRRQAALGVTPTPEVMMNMQESGQAMRFYNRNAALLGDVSTGIPLSQGQLALLEQDPDMTPTLRADIARKQQAAQEHVMKDRGLKLEARGLDQKDVMIRQTERARDMQEVQVHRQDAQMLQQELQSIQQLAGTQNWPKEKIMAEQNRVMARYLHSSEAADAAKERYYAKWTPGVGLKLELRGDNEAIAGFKASLKGPDEVLPTLEAYRRNLESRKAYLFELGPSGITHYQNMIGEYMQLKREWEAKKTTTPISPPGLSEWMDDPRGVGNLIDEYITKPVDKLLNSQPFGPTTTRGRGASGSWEIPQPPTLQPKPLIPSFPPS